jgi:hypothetical protein
MKKIKKDGISPRKKQKGREERLRQDRRGCVSRRPLAAYQTPSSILRGNQSSLPLERIPRPFGRLRAAG